MKGCCALVIGATLVTIGLLLLLLPGPGTLVVLLGLAILARKFGRGHRLSERLRARRRGASRQ